jgi:hypothetical protein
MIPIRYSCTECSKDIRHRRRGALTCGPKCRQMRCRRLDAEAARRLLSQMELASVTGKAELR